MQLFFAIKNDVDVIGFNFFLYGLLSLLQISLLADAKNALIIANIHWVFTMSFHNMPSGAINSLHVSFH